jgi:2-C-methyl-D-erythritol 2,4-cyclodiphosphate synthase
MDLRIGHGYDVHKFAREETADAFLTLAGVQVPHDRVLLAHSDGDVAVHALCDGILGALGAGDIGQHFPDSEPAFANIDSCLLLQKVRALASEAGWRIGNVDLTIVAQAPRLAAYIPRMRERLAAELDVEQTCANVKATTEEGLGFTGRQEGIAAHAVVLLVRDASSDRQS